MKWLYKFESKMDCGDADWIYRNGELGTFDDQNRAAMVNVFLTIILLTEIANQYADGTFDTERVLDCFKGTCATTNITEEEMEKFIKDEELEEELYSFSDDYIPTSPDICGNTHDLSFKFSRIPETVRAEKVSVNDVDKFVKASR